MLGRGVGVGWVLCMCIGCVHSIGGDWVGRSILGRFGVLRCGFEVVYMVEV